MYFVRLIYKLLFCFIFYFLECNFALSQKYNIVIWDDGMHPHWNGKSDTININSLKQFLKKDGLFIIYFGREIIDTSLYKLPYSMGGYMSTSSFYDDEIDIKHIYRGDSCFRITDSLPSGKWYKINYQKNKVIVFAQKGVKKFFLHGLYKLNYEDGSPEFEVTYQFGYPIGLAIKWHSNGSKSSEWYYSDTCETILYNKHYFQNGKLEYIHDYSSGDYKWYYINGNIKERGNESFDGIKQGRFKYYNENGILKREKIYKNNKLIKVRIAN